MPDVSLCPSGEELKQFAQGSLAEASAERVIEHLRSCRSCLAVLEGTPIEDTLIEALQTWGDSTKASNKSEIEGLIHRLKKLAVGPAADPEATAADAPSTKATTFDFLSPPQGAGEIGRLGGYRVVEVLGSGGMGVVFAAEDVRLKRKVALKVMKPEVAANAGSRQRFLREAEASAAVRSDHVITIYQVGEQGDAPFLAMEYLEGMSLDDWLKKGRKPTVAQAARMGRQIALGLAAAHERGLIHRDIKPANIWLESHHQGRVKLLDFGLARGTADEVHLTQSGAIVGTPAYMAPEQARGEHVDHRCDLFSLGVVLYRLTTGQLPFRGDNTMSVLTSLALDTPKPPREIDGDIPPRMATLIERLLAKDREQRPKTAKAVADELAAIEREAMQPATEDRTVQIRAASVSAPVVRAAHAAQRRKRWRWLVAASLLLLLGGVAAAIVVIIRDSQGNKIAEINVPDKGTVEIKGDSKGKDEAKGPPVAPKQEAPIAAALAPLRSGEPLSPLALVQQPAKLPGVRSWSIEVRKPGGEVSLAYRPDGKRLAVGYRDGSIRVWDPESGRLVQLLLSSHAGIWAMAWSPDGRVLAAINAVPAPVRLWDAENGRLLQALEPSIGGQGSSLAWSSDGRTLRARAEPTSEFVFSWNAADGKLVGKPSIPSITHMIASLSPDAKLLAAIEADGRAAIWDAVKGGKVRVLGIPKWNNLLPRIAWSPDGKRLAFEDVEKGTHVWELESDKECFHLAEPNANYHEWSPDGRFLAYTTYSGVRQGTILEVAAGAKPKKLEGSVEDLSAWSPDGKTIARIPISWGDSPKGCIRLYDVATGKLRKSLSEGGGEVLPTVCSLDGQTMAVWENGQTTVASVDTGQIHTVLKDTKLPISLSPDGRRIVTGGPDHTLILWESGGKVRIVLNGHAQEPAWASWSPDGKRLVSKAHEEKRLLLWDADKGERLRELGPCDATPYWPGRWSPDGRLLAFFVSNVGWHFWDVEQNKLVNDPKQWQENLALKPDSRSALTWRHHQSGRLQTIISGKKEGELLTAIAGEAAWSPDGRWLAVRGPSGVEIWRGDLRRRLQTLARHTWAAEQLAFSPDGKLVECRALDFVQIWEAETGRLHGSLFLGEHGNGFTITSEGHYNGNEQVERGIVAVVQKDDGTQELLEPDDFERKYGWKNDPNKVHLLQPLPRPLYPLPGMPMGPKALVREPAELPDANSWTIETCSARGAVKAIAYHPDGKLLATGGEDGAIRIWDTASGELVRILIGGDLVDFLAWSKDGILAASYRGWETWLWEVSTGRLLRRIAGPTGHLYWTPDGRTLVIADPGKVRFHDAATGKVLRSFDFPGSVYYCAWPPDGKFIAFAVQGEKTVRLYDMTTGKEVHKLEGHQGAVTGLAWSPDGKRLASLAGSEREFLVWDAGTGKLQGRIPVKDIGNMTGAPIAWSPEGKTIALGFNQGSHGLFDVETGRLLHTFNAGHNVGTLAFSPDGKQAATAGSHGVRLHKTSSGKLQHVLEGVILFGGITSLAWNPDGRLLALSHQDGWYGSRIEAATGRGQAPLSKEGWRASAWSADGKTFAVLNAEGNVQLWDAATDRLVRTLEGKPEPTANLLAWSADGKKLAAGGGSRLRVWTSDGKLLWQNDKHQLLSGITWSPDGRLTTIDRGEKGAVRLWEAEAGKLLHEVAVAAQNEIAAAWSRDGKTLAIAIQGEILLMDGASFAIRLRTPVPESFYHLKAVRWSADGKSILALERDVRLLRFDTDTGKRVSSLVCSGFPGGSTCGSWSADGRLMAHGGSLEIHFYDGEGQGILGTLLPSDVFGQMTVTADGHYRGNTRVERLIRMVVQKRDGTSETLTPQEFEQKYNFKNDPAQVRLIDK